MLGAYETNRKREKQSFPCENSGQRNSKLRVVRNEHLEEKEKEACTFIVES